MLTGGGEVGPAQGSRLILAPVAPPAEASDERRGAGGGGGGGGEEDDEGWVSRSPECLLLSPSSLEPGGGGGGGHAGGAGAGAGGAEGVEEVGVAVKGSPFWTFLGTLTREGAGGVTLGGGAGAAGGVGEGTLVAGSASVVRLQCSVPQTLSPAGSSSSTRNVPQMLYSLGVQVDADGC